LHALVCSSTSRSATASAHVMGCGASSSKSPSSDPIEGKPVAAITAQPAAANSSAGGKPAAAAADDDDDMWSVPPPPPLSAERRERVKQLYNVFFAAMGKEGGIPVKDLQALSTSQIGPHKAFPLAGDVIEAIDDNSDGFLSEEELVSYFTKSSSALNDGEFNVVLDDIIEHAPTNIAAAVEEQRELDAMFAPPPAPELSEARAASIKDLFAAFAASCGSTDAGVEVRKMQECAKTKLGNATALPLAGDEFQAMDTDGDGSVSEAELLTWFKTASAALSDDEFSVIMEEMITSVKTSVPDAE